MKGFKHRLELNNKQITLAFQHAGVSRHAYNWGVNLCNEISEKREKLPTGFDLCKLLVKNVKSVNKWYYDVSKCSPQKALLDLNVAWKRYFSDLKKGIIVKRRNSYIKECKSKGREINEHKLYNIGKPKFKKKGVKDSFYLDGRYIFVIGNRIKVPIFGWIKMSESHDEEFKVKNVVISRTADKWFISFKKELEDTNIKGIENKSIVGVDLGIKVLATYSNGETVENVKAYKKYKRKLKIAQRVVSKRYDEDIKIQSQNYYKANNKVSKLHYKISCIRKDAIHKLTTDLAKNHSLIGIEDLNVSGMMKNHRLAGAIQDGGFYEFRRQLEYKTKWYGSKLVVIDRYFPSSKMCSCCGNIKKDLKLSNRVYKCENCGLSMDRDLNASINIRNEADSYVASACGELHKPEYNIVGNSTKQESNSNMLSVA